MHGFHLLSLSIHRNATFRLEFQYNGETKLKTERKFKNLSQNYTKKAPYQENDGRTRGLTWKNSFAVSISLMGKNERGCFCVRNRAAATEVLHTMAREFEAAIMKNLPSKIY